MRVLFRWFSRAYGAGPHQLLLVLGAFALTAYVVVLLGPDSGLTRMVVWFLAAVVLHDLLLFPVYAGADRLLRAGARRGRTVVGWINHVRMPVLGSALLLLVFLPGIIRQGEFTYYAATGQTQQPFLGRWLLLTAGMFALSASWYLVRVVRSRYLDVGRDVN
ncbi:hypothetical protein SAMN04487820_107275 [Actinopolyspora mzabensis]|uniref:Uncharacterized protein n=1 Tax=Actinopolyspora mzabensis TaxID=995066 RepID=A0A1G9BPB6_ACTMZ|nr:hypothetical protein [Actinopolyspora mzabensis]SDK41351.1 hypothetical protein SAMN04487820_107275 [Actinopolyspora mzabensis]